MFGLRTECWRVFGVLLVCFGAAKSGSQEDCRKDFDATVRGIGLLQYEKSLEELQQMYSGSWERNVAINGLIWGMKLGIQALVVVGEAHSYQEMGTADDAAFAKLVSAQQCAAAHCGFAC